MADTQALAITGMTGGQVRDAVKRAIDNGDANGVASLRTAYPLTVVAYFANNEEQLTAAYKLLTSSSCKDRQMQGLPDVATLAELADTLKEEADFLKDHELFDKPSQGTA